MNADNPFPGERTAVITGAASPRGIGRATADRLARDGWSIAILDLDDEAAKRTAAEIAGNRSVASLGVAADVSDEDSVEAAIARVEAKTLRPRAVQVSKHLRDGPLAEAAPRRGQQRGHSNVRPYH
jgi:NAD(P)-dependent dehydrogenase (short-subunit alcohol dehydrogenase family)